MISLYDLMEINDAYDKIANLFIEQVVKTMTDLNEAIDKIYREENPLPRPSNKVYFKNKGREYIKPFKRNLPYQRRDYWCMVS